MIKSNLIAGPVDASNPQLLPEIAEPVTSPSLQTTSWQIAAEGPNPKAILQSTCPALLWHHLFYQKRPTISWHQSDDGLILGTAPIL